MSERIRAALRWSLTLLLLAASVASAYQLWWYYNREPWTRDGRVRADIAQIAPDVSGWVTSVAVRDNQWVTKGEILFTIDRRRFELAKQRADATVHQLDVEIAQARRENTRNGQLGDLASIELREQSQSKLDTLAASKSQAMANLEEAVLNLERTQVFAPVSGVVTNIELQPGDYATAGHPEFALLATDSLRVEGYFEETKIAYIKVGDRAEVIQMGDSQPIRGHVESIASAIEDRDRSNSNRLLASVNPTFNWVRLAQRVPVRIKVDQLPPGTILVAGRTASVRIQPRSTVGER
jgi:RND family efflux transporter MFP subunit